MGNVFLNIHRQELFEGFVRQDCFSWDVSNPADFERLKQWKKLFDKAYDDVSSKRVGSKDSSYIECRDYICKNW